MSEVPPRPVAGVVGTGAMGLGIARSLVREGFDTVTRDSAPDADARAAAAGCRVLANAAAVAAAAPVVFVVVVDDREVDDVIFGPDGLASAGTSGLVVLVCSTLDPDYVRGLPDRAGAHGLAIVDAPISGGPAKAADGSMTMMLAAPRYALDRAAPAVAAVAGHRFVVSERAGDAAATKIVNNLLAGANLAAAGEALALADALGLDAGATAEVIGASSGASWIFADRVPRALAGDLAPRAAARILAKDLAIACSVSERAGLPGDFARTARRTFVDAVAAGHGERDDAVIVQHARATAARRGRPPR